MQDFHVTINKSGRLVIPAPIRKKLNLRSGDEVIVNLSEENDIKIQTVKKTLNTLQEIIKEKNLSLSEELIRIRRKEII